MFINDFVCDETEIIQLDKFKEFAQTNPNITFYKTDMFISWLSSSLVINHETINNIKPGNVIIIGNSDISITDYVCKLINKNAKMIFCSNCHRGNETAFSLPIGISNKTNYVHGETDIFPVLLKTPKMKYNWVYMNMAIYTYPVERQKVFDMFKGFSWVTNEKPQLNSQHRNNFLSQIYNHPFVLCPRGNGTDTHRIWETLYLKSIPIVKMEIGYQDFTDLPILFVNDWSEVTLDYLIQQYDIIHSKEWNMEKLTMTWWKNEILKYV